MFASLLLPGGRLADRLGRRRLFLWTLVGFTVASALCALAPSPEALIAGRVLQAASGAVLVPASQALLLTEFPQERWPVAVALWAGASAVAAAIGPSLGALLIEATDWRVLFLINLPIGLATLAYGRRILRESHEPGGAARPDALGVLLAAGGVGALALAIVQGPEWGWGDARVVAAFAAAALLLPLLLARSARHPAPVIDVALLRTPAIAMANAATLFVALAFFAVIFSTVLYLTGVWRYSILETGLALSPGPLLAAIVAGPGGRLAERFRPAPVALAGSLLIALGGAWLVAVVGSEPAFVAEWLPGSLLVGAGGGLAVPTLSAAAVAPLPAARFAVGSG